MCEITINSDSVFRVGDTLNVSGTVDGCGKEFDTGSVIRVDFECNGVVTADFPEVSDQGDWYATVRDLDCKCTQDPEPPQIVTVTVTCLAPEREPCLPVVSDLPLICVSGCITQTSDPDGDDVSSLETDWFCEPDGGPNALVTIRQWYDNQLPFDAFVNLANPALAAPVNPVLVPAGTIQQIEFVATVSTPLVSPNDIFTIFYTDSTGAVIPCPGFTTTITIASSCCPLNEAPRITVTTNGCTATFSWDPEQVPDGCVLQFDFKDPDNLSAQFSDPGAPEKSHTYGKDGGPYEDLTVFVKCDNGCTGSPRIFGPVTITGCTGNPPDDPVVDPVSDPESGFCAGVRILAVVTGAMVLFLLAAAWCLSSVPLVKGAALLAIISAVFWVAYWLFGCNKPCGFGKLSTAETLIAAGLALLTYSGCCTWQFLLTGALFLGFGLYLFYKWKDDCNFSNCHAWGELARLGAAVTTYLIFIIDLFPGMTACKAAIVTWQGVDINGSTLVLVVTSFTVFKVAACIQAIAPEDQVATDE